MIVLTSTISSISEMEKVDQYISDIARNGGHAALEQLYLSVKDAVFGYAVSILKNTHDAEDILHDCCIAIYQSAHLYKSVGKPMAWILTITRNLCLGKLRSRSRFSDLPEEDWEPYLKSNERISMEDKVVLEHCLRDLQDDEREILLLHIFSGMKHREIAELTGKPLSTVLSKYHRALKNQSEAAAKQAAYNHAGVDANTVIYSVCELEHNHGFRIYEIEFAAGGYEYEYDVNAETCEVIRYSKETDDDYRAPETGSSNSSSGDVGAAAAKAAALSHAGVSDVRDFECELDYEWGKAVYEISFEAGGYEYEYEVDAATGLVLRSEKERD